MKYIKIVEIGRVMYCCDSCGRKDISPKYNCLFCKKDLCKNCFHLDNVCQKHKQLYQSYLIERQKLWDECVNIATKISDNKHVELYEEYLTKRQKLWENYEENKEK